ncbi:MAG: hypothetical protein ACJAUA_000847 [Zhongshania aliphaticivorans]|jgi:hypothetical protein
MNYFYTQLNPKGSRLKAEISNLTHGNEQEVLAQSLRQN